MVRGVPQERDGDQEDAREDDWQCLLGVIEEIAETAENAEISEIAENAEISEIADRGWNLNLLAHYLI
jgi:hypothetical protein